MDADSGLQPSVPRLSVVPVSYGCKACDWEADRAVRGRFQRPTQSSVIADVGERVRARWPTRSPRAWRRSDGRNRERCGMRPVPGFGGAAATHARPPRARAAADVLRSALRALLRADDALCRCG
jgi:hypothetical protein